MNKKPQCRLSEIEALFFEFTLPEHPAVLFSPQS